MKYLVMETHPAYAVMLDENGRFLKAANLRYQVGETVEEIVELKVSRPAKAAVWKPLSGLAALAACLCLVFFGYYRPNFTAYGTLRIQINPDLEMTVSQTDRVLDLEGLNADGADLIEGYAYQGKDRETATEELVERAIEMGYLSDGDTVSITVDSSDSDWQAREEEQVRRQLEERYGERIVIQLGSAAQQTEGSAQQAQSSTQQTQEQTQDAAQTGEVVIQVPPQTAGSSEGGAVSGDSGYEAPDADDDDDGGASDYSASDYGGGTAQGTGQGTGSGGSPGGGQPQPGDTATGGDDGGSPYTDGATDYGNRDGDDDGDDDSDDEDDDEGEDGDD